MEVQRNTADRNLNSNFEFRRALIKYSLWTFEDTSSLSMNSNSDALAPFSSAVGGTPAISLKTPDALGDAGGSQHQ